ncbi:MAG: MarR family transcriptional regulator [Alphaproteobacteria bacterium]
MAAADGKPELRLWLRLLTCSNMIEAEVRARLRRDFAVTLPRFDLLAQLDRTPQGLTMGALSRRLMVTNGNVTGVVERLAAERLISRTPAPNDRRTQLVRLTPAGRKAFRTMAAAHERWIAGIFGDLSRAEIAALMDLLGRAKQSVHADPGGALGG